ncbi:ribonuclease P protein component [Catenovulum sp. SM1970]|uniref:ribonuclease P protein component n=1 Tax=Marinifaba aquimaris TaxID=2741323 RepID=UPI00157423B5|nr:ribonuclease P protein component [Marinifaba aquimaris]NTS76351.1 ribonuclease P protein component [Marinifaba aquimaris]
MKSYPYGRELRVLTPAQFSNIFNSNPRKFACRLYTILLCKNDLDNPRLGFTISKKKVKLAVNRNRVKRIVRDNFRLNQAELPNVDMVFIARQGIDQVDNAQIHQELNNTWQKLRKFANKL